MRVKTNRACNWLSAGDEIFPALLAAIDAAQKTVCLEIYIFTDSPVGRLFREVLIRARERGARVRVLMDAVGSVFLSDVFWAPLRNAGGEVRWFNPIALKRVTIRAHRQLLGCQGQGAFVGG